MLRKEVVYSDKLALVGYSERSEDGEPVALIALRHDSDGNEKSDFSLHATAQPWDTDKIQANRKKLSGEPKDE